MFCIAKKKLNIQPIWNLTLINSLKPLIDEESSGKRFHTSKKIVASPPPSRNSFIGEAACGLNIIMSTFFEQARLAAAAVKGVFKAKFDTEAKHHQLLLTSRSQLLRFVNRKYMTGRLREELIYRLALKGNSRKNVSLESWHCARSAPMLSLDACQTTHTYNNRNKDQLQDRQAKRKLTEWACQWNGKDFSERNRHIAHRFAGAEVPVTELSFPLSP